MMRHDVFRDVDWMQDELYGFPDDFHISWKYKENQIHPFFTYHPSEQDKLHELLQPEEGYLNSFVTELARIVNDSYYGKDNSRFYTIKQYGMGFSTAQSRFFLDNAAKEEQKPTAIKNGTCCEAGYEFRTLFHELNLQPFISTLRVLSPYELPEEYKTEKETEFKHVQTAIYIPKKHWALVNAYTPRNDLTLLSKENMPPQSAVQCIDVLAAAEKDDFIFSQKNPDNQ